jgi:hypothetical protein
MKVSTEIDNNFGYEKITQLVDNIPLIHVQVIYNIPVVKHPISKVMAQFFMYLKTKLAYTTDAAC